jgi:DNA-binding XRE family transcriptional regulator
MVCKLIHEVAISIKELQKVNFSDNLHLRMFWYHANEMTEIKGGSRDPDAVCLGLIVKRHRMQRGWSLQQLGAAIDVHPTHVGVIERGGNLPGLKTLLKLAQVLGVDPGDMLREMLANREQFRPRATPQE